MSLSSLFDRLPREIANTHPDGWVVGIREARLARILRPYERPLIEALAAHLDGAVRYESDGAVCVITLRTHHLSADRAGVAEMGGASDV